MELNLTAAAENSGSSGSNVTETKYIPAGQVPMILWGILELGAHTPMFKGAPAVYDKGKRSGEVKDPEMHIRFLFEASHLPFDDEALTLGDSPFDFIGLPLYAFQDNSKITNKMKFFKFISNLVACVGHPGGTFKLSSLLGAKVKINVTNKPVPEDKLPKDAAGNKVADYQYANYKYTDISSTKVYSTTNPDQILEDVASLLPDVPKHKVLYFSWTNPTPEAFKAMKPWHREQVRTALNLEGSAVELMFNMDPTLWTMDDKPEDTDTPNEGTTPPPVPPDSPLPGVPPVLNVGTVTAEIQGVAPGINTAIIQPIIAPPIIPTVIPEVVQEIPPTTQPVMQAVIQPVVQPPVMAMPSLVPVQGV